MTSPTDANGLYEAMRSGGSGRRLSLASAALVGLLTPVSLALSAAESLAGRGGTVTLWATK